MLVTSMHGAHLQVSFGLSPFVPTAMKPKPNAINREEPEDLPSHTRAPSVMKALPAGELRKCRCWKCQGPHHKRAPSVEIAPPAGEHVEETQCVEETPSFKAFMDAVNADAPDSDNYPDDKSDDRCDHDETSDEPATSSQEHGLN